MTEHLEPGSIGPDALDHLIRPASKIRWQNPMPRTRAEAAAATAQIDEDPKVTREVRPARTATPTTRRQKCSDIPDEHVIRLAHRWHQADFNDRVPVYDALLDEGWHPKVAWTKLVRLNDRRLLDCGVNERSSWPTPAGLALIGAEPAPQTRSALPFIPQGAVREEYERLLAKFLVHGEAFTEVPHP